MSSDLYYVRINRIEYRDNNIILYIQIIPTGACGINYFPENLKKFFFTALYNIDNYFDFCPKKDKLDLQESKNNVLENTILHDIKIKPFGDLNIYINDDKWVDENLYKYIKDVKMYKTSYQELVDLLKIYNFQNKKSDEEKSICCYCKNFFKCKNDILTSKLIIRAKTILNTNDKNIIKSYMKDKFGIIVENMQDINDSIYDRDKQSTEKFYFKSPQEILYFCYTIRFCSSVCGLKNLKKEIENYPKPKGLGKINDIQKELYMFNGEDIIHTYGGIEYEVLLEKNKVDNKILESIKHMMFRTLSF